ncbi:MAG: hypothetical protein Q8L74_07865 [Nitrospirota bacterium]|nr:hypothetical protein [Nitrospirota bacterium]MDP2381508.1 hypothetical protein [Nitrospirota bacterium]MDP3596858.1 hypothetical protein [Nitrospirota bacterium]
MPVFESVFYEIAALLMIAAVCGAIVIRDVNLALMSALRHHGYTGRVAATATTVEEQAVLERAGAHLVLVPYADAAARAIDAVAGSVPPPSWMQTSARQAPESIVPESSGPRPDELSQSILHPVRRTVPQQPEE